MRINVEPDPEATFESNAGSGVILVGTDGQQQSRGALAAAAAASARLGLDVHVLAVHWPKPFLTAEAPLVFDPYVEAARRAELLRRARMQTADYADTRVFGSPEVRDGDPAGVIAQIAAERRAQLVIVGLGRHNVVDRLFGDETALRLVRVCRSPMLAVPASFSPQFATAPRRAIVAMDFSEGSTRAAQATLRLVPPGSVIQVVHVMPREQDLGYALIPVDEYLRTVTSNFALLRDRITIPPDVRVEELTLTGSPAPELMKLADATKADLVAAGSHGYGFLARLVIGSVTSKLLRGASCAVLVVPPDAAPETLGSDVQERDATRTDRPAYA